MPKKKLKPDNEPVNDILTCLSRLEISDEIIDNDDMFFIQFAEAFPDSYRAKGENQESKIDSFSLFPPEGSCSINIRVNQDTLYVFSFGGFYPESLALTR